MSDARRTSAPLVPHEGSPHEDRPAFERLTGPGGLTYQPGLDGLRGIAVAAVFAFHLGFGGVTGGYLGVSLFFTLSGVLIGTLILNEITTTGRFSLSTFWLRRARRLLPPALVTLALIAVGRLLTARLNATSGADVIAAALNVANWHFLAEGSSYGELFSGPSAVLHFWSLAIEEQFYLAAGLLSVLLASTVRRPVRTVGIVAGVVATCSFLAPLVVGFSVDRVYYGTDTRAGELMIGVAMAAVIASAGRRRVMLLAAPVLAVVSALALAGTALLWHAATPGSNSLRDGLLPVTAALSVLLITGALLPAGPVAALTRLGAIRWLGRVSYAVYLIHWPVIVIANQITSDRSIVRSAVLVAISLGLAQLSAMFVERPVRRQRVRLGLLAVAASLAFGSIGVASTFEGRTTESAELLGRLSDEQPAAQAGGVASGGDADLPRVALFGDSVGFSMLLALGNATVEPDFVRTASDVNLGCGIAMSPSPPPDQPHMCDDPANRFALKAAAGQVTVAIMFSCQWELLSQPIPGRDDDAHTIGEPAFDAFVREQYEQVADGLSNAGVERILWVSCPYMSRVTGMNGLALTFAASRNPERVDHLNAIVAELAADRGDVDVLPFDDWVNERVDDAAIRPDGSHYEYAGHNPAADAFITLINTTLTT